MAACQGEARVASQLTDFDQSMITCGLDGAIRTWTQHGQMEKEFPGVHDGSVRGIVKIGKFAVTGGAKDGKLKLWDWGKEKWLFDLQDSGTIISHMIADFGKLGVASWDRKDGLTVQVWTLNEIDEFALRFVTEEEL